MEVHCGGKFHRVSRIESSTLRPCRMKITIWSYVALVVVSWLYLVVPCGTESPQQLQVYYTLTEERDPVSTVVARLLEEQVITDAIGDVPVEDVFFQFISEMPAFFELDTQSGVLTIAERVDRDKQCPNEDKCEIQFSLTLEPITPVTLISVVINIVDINDHPPQFLESSIIKSVPESTLPGYAFVLPKVTDPDSPDFSVQSYELSTTPAEQFVLKTSTKPDGSSDVRLVLGGTLDRETSPEYQIKVTAADGGDPPMSGTLDITIIVTDANDNNPTFDQGTYEVSIPENVIHGYFVVGVHASDIDTGLNSKIVYRFSADTVANLGHVFAINNDTGEITIRGEVDYEEAATLYLTVEARDLGADPVPAEAVVIVHIEDANDHAPEILLHTLGGPGVQEATVLEGASTGTFVARVVVSDEDSGENGRYNCSLQEEHFVLDPLGTDFLITTRGDLDRETQALYSLAITCRDFGRQPLTAITYIQVKLQDINDNSPRFSQSSYSWQITENNDPMAVLLQVNATDMDEDENAEIEYSIQGPESLRFDVDAVTGVVRATISLDRELESRHTILLVATDKGDSTRSGTASLVLEVLDANDEAPRFRLDMYPFSVPENEESDLEVGFVQAEDSDSSQFNKHTFSIQDTSAPFQITLDTGRISTTESLDREEQRVYSLIVLATDTSEPYFSSSATVSVYIVDRNDNPPRFTFPTPDNNTVHISNNVALGQIVTRVVAEDLDIDRNGRIAYEIVHASQDGVFTIDRNMGAITVGTDVTNMDNMSLALSIIASDNGPSPMSTSVTLNIAISKALPGQLQGEELDVGPNVIILVSVACISGILIVSLILAIVIMLRKQRHMQHKNHHNNRMAALNIMATGDEQTVKASHRPEFTNLHGDGSTSDPQPDLMMELQGSRDMKNLSPPPFSTAQNTYTTSCKSNKVDLSLEKSRQWLETLEHHPQSEPGQLSPGRQCVSPTRESAPPPCPPAATKVSVVGVQPLKSCLKNPLPESVRKESGDSDSVNSAAVSNTDSGHGTSELDDVLPPRGITYSPGGIQSAAADKNIQSRGYHSNQLREQLKTSAARNLNVHASSPRQQPNPPQRHLTSHQAYVPDYLGRRDPCTTRRECNKSPLISFGKTSAGHTDPFSRSANPTLGNSCQNSGINNTNNISHVYSLGSASDVIAKSRESSFGSNRHGKKHVHDDDDASSMSGSYVVDASALIREIDDVFFKDIVV